MFLSCERRSLIGIRQGAQCGGSLIRERIRHGERQHGSACVAGSVYHGCLSLPHSRLHITIGRPGTPPRTTFTVPPVGANTRQNINTSIRHEGGFARTVANWTPDSRSRAPRETVTVTSPLVRSTALGVATQLPKDGRGRVVAHDHVDGSGEHSGRRGDGGSAGPIPEDNAERVDGRDQ